MRMNEFATIDAQDEISRYAQMTTEEHSEMQEWIDSVRAIEEEIFADWADQCAAFDEAAGAE